eukprot:7664525-Lingulodinium_polyedra.AAC.1
MEKQEEATDFAKKRFAEEAATNEKRTEGANQSKVCEEPSNCRESGQRDKLAMAHARKRHTAWGGTSRE